MENKAPEIGLIPLSLPRERTDLAQGFAVAAAETLRGRGFAVDTTGELVLDTERCLTAACGFRDGGADCILILLGTWVFSPTVVDTVRAVDLPFGIWAVDDPASFSLTAGGIVHGSLEELGLKHRFFYGSPRSERLLDELAAFARAAACRRRLSGRRLCVIGGRVPGMYTTMADLIQVKNLFGVEIEHVDSMRVYLEARSASEDQVAALKAQLAAELGRIETAPEALDRSIRLYLATRSILQQEGCSMTAVKCQEEMSDGYASFCLAASLLNDAGLSFSCEADINAALTMEILRGVSGQPVLFGDVNHLDLERNLLRIVNCGSMPTGMAESRRRVVLKDQYEYLSKAGGATTVFSVKESPVTVARLFRIRGRYAMTAWEGQTRALPRERFQETRESWPQALVELDPAAGNVVQNLRSNHLHLCFGRHLDSLRELCALLDIELREPR